MFSLVEPPLALAARGLGTDVLMRGDEAGLGTPEEDMRQIAAAVRGEFGDTARRTIPH